MDSESSTQLYLCGRTKARLFTECALHTRAGSVLTPPTHYLSELHDNLQLGTSNILGLQGTSAAGWGQKPMVTCPCCGDRQSAEPTRSSRGTWQWESEA